MAWFLFLDESGHDHKKMPYEVRGGIALQDSQLWPFTRNVQQLEQSVFGCVLRDFQKELKGARFSIANGSNSRVSCPRCHRPNGKSTVEHFS